MAEIITDHHTLSNGMKIPAIGFGTWKLLEDDCISAVKCAIDSGYRLIDTATAYRNEKSVGRAIAESGINRNELFITSKLWNSSKGYDEAIAACRKSLEFLGLDYLDLYLIHWPRSIKHFDDYVELNNETWRAFETLYNDGLVRAIGISNFLPHHLKPLVENAHVLPMVEQMELSVQCRQDEAVAYARRLGMAVEAYSPLTRCNVFNAPQMARICKKHNCTGAEVCLCWCLLQGYIPLPKSVTPERIKQNIKKADFTLDEEDLSLLDELSVLGRMVADPDNPPF